MSKDILGMYGPDSPSNQRPRATNGGQMPVSPVRYSSPQGPKGIMDKQMGIGGGNSGHGLRHSPGQSESKTSIPGTNHGNCGSQGCR